MCGVTQLLDWSWKEFQVQGFGGLELCGSRFGSVEYHMAALGSLLFGVGASNFSKHSQGCDCRGEVAIFVPIFACYVRLLYRSTLHL